MVETVLVVFNYPTRRIAVCLNLGLFPFFIRGVARAARIAFFDVSGPDDGNSVTPPYPDGKMRYGKFRRCDVDKARFIEA